MEQRHRDRGRPPQARLNGALLFRTLFDTWPGTFIAISAYQLVDSLAQFGIPLSLHYLVDFIKGYERGGPIPPTAYAMAALLFVAPALSAVANVQQFRCARRLIFRWRAALIALVFRQTLRLDPSVASYSSGQVINLCSVDAGNSDAIRYFPALFSVPLEVAISIGLIFWVLQNWISGLVVSRRIDRHNQALSFTPSSIKSTQTHAPMYISIYTHIKLRRALSSWPSPSTPPCASPSGCGPRRGSSCAARTRGSRCWARRCRACGPSSSWPGSGTFCKRYFRMDGLA